MNEWDELEFKDIKKERNSFKLNQIKISNFYTYDSDYVKGQVISNSIEIINNKMIININYIDNELNKKNDITEKSINSDILKNIESIDLRGLNNNYIYEDNGNYWSIEYNNKFKICGDFNNTIDKYNTIIEIIDYKNIINNRLKEINGE